MRSLVPSSFCRIAAALAVVLAAAFAQARAQDASDLVKVELLAEPEAITPGEPFQVGIRLTMKEHWHTYWRNPGDLGEPTHGDLEAAGRLHGVRAANGRRRL